MTNTNGQLPFHDFKNAYDNHFNNKCNHDNRYVNTNSVVLQLRHASNIKKTNYRTVYFFLNDMKVKMKMVVRVKVKV